MDIYEFIDKNRFFQNDLKKRALHRDADYADNDKNIFLKMWIILDI